MKKRIIILSVVLSVIGVTCIACTNKKSEKADSVQDTNDIKNTLLSDNDKEASGDDGFKEVEEVPSTEQTADKDKKSEVTVSDDGTVTETIGDGVSSVKPVVNGQSSASSTDDDDKENDNQENGDKENGDKEINGDTDQGDDECDSNEDSGSLKNFFDKDGDGWIDALLGLGN